MKHALRWLLFCVVMTAALVVPSARAESVSEVVAALAELENHILGSTTLSGPHIAARKVMVADNASLFGSSTLVMSAAFDLVDTYDTQVGPLWLAGSPIQSFSRSTVTDEDIDWVVYTVMQTIVDETYTVANVATNETLLDGQLFGSSAHFPGTVDTPLSNTTHTATIHAGYLDTLGWAGESGTARKPTGTYLAPGTIATVTVPTSIVGKGYLVRVGANSWDLKNKSTVKRLDRSSIVYAIDSTQIKVGSPLGGGIYIEVPYLSDEGVVDVDITGAVRSPFFSVNGVTGHNTTLSEWQNTERHHPAPWADFQTERFMMYVPTDWIHNWDDPATVLADWDHAADMMNDLMGYPRIRGKEALYLGVDLILRVNAYSTGYPTANYTYNPNSDYGGLANNHFTRGPLHVASYLFHEQGHAYLFKKFDGETESTVNLLHVPIWNVGFGVDLDAAFAASRGFENNSDRTLDNTAVAWMTCFNFRNGLEMAEKEKKYQLKGHAKFVDIARLFGWQTVNDYFHQMVVDGVDRDADETEDQLVDRLSAAAGVDTRPLMHFWGLHPGSGAIHSPLFPESIEIYDLLVSYRGMIPVDNAAFQVFASRWWNHTPSLDGHQTENEHAQQWDSYDTNTCAAIQARLDAIMGLYFPHGPPVDDVVPPTPNPMNWALPPAAFDAATVKMEAARASDRSNPVEYYFENTSNGDDSGWIAGTSWSNTGLTAGQSYSYRCRARDREGNVGSWSSVETAVPAEDNTPPTPSPMAWESPPAKLSSSAIIMTAATANDPIGVEYYFACTAGGGHHSGWQDSPTYLDAGLSPLTTYSYTVKARDTSANANQTAVSAAESATTLEVPGVLFADTFNRADSSDLNASTGGKSGLFGALHYTARTFNAVDLDISSNTLRMNGPASNGSYGGLVYIDDHNFTDAAIAAGGGFSIRVDIAAYSTAGSSRQMSVGVGQSLDELATQPGADPQSHRSDLVVAYRHTTDDLEIYKNGLLDSGESVFSGLPNAPTTMRIEYTFTDFLAGSTVIYNVYFDDATTAFTSGTFAWSGSFENYISLASNLSNNSLFDNLEIRGEETYDDHVLPTPDPMTWAIPPFAVTNDAISMWASDAHDLSGVEYYFTCVAGDGHDSGWQDSPIYTDAGLLPDTTYAYTVMVRDKSVNQNSTAASVEASATTPDAPDVVPIAGVDFENDANSAFDPSPDDLNESDGITVSAGWTVAGAASGVTLDNNANAAGSTSGSFVAKLNGGSDRYAPSRLPSVTQTADYYAWSITIPADVVLNLTEITFDLRQGTGTSGNTRWAMFNTSLDGGPGSPALWGLDLPPLRGGGWANVTVDLSGAAYQGLTDTTVTFYWYNEWSGSDVDTMVVSGFIGSADPEIGTMDMEAVSGSEVGFSWYGEAGVTYGLEVTEDLVAGDWSTLTNVVGSGSIISLTSGTDRTNAFYRVYLVD